MSTQVEELHATPTTPAAPALVGLLAEYPDVDAVVTAARNVRAAGYKMWDVHSPFPIHGIDAVIGIRPTILPWLVLGAGLAGLVGGLGMQWYTNAFDYPFFISGKPLFSLPANVPVMFECTVLLSALTAVFGMLMLCRLPMLYNPLFKLNRFRRVTNDKFFIVIAASDAKFDADKTADLLRSLGAITVDRIED